MQDILYLFVADYMKWLAGWSLLCFTVVHVDDNNKERIEVK